MLSGLLNKSMKASPIWNADDITSLESPKYRFNALYAHIAGEPNDSCTISFACFWISLEETLLGNDGNLGELLSRIERNSTRYSFARIVSVFLIITPIGGICAMIFQGMGKGTLSLMLTIVRELVFVVILSYTFGILLNFGVNGILFGLILGLAVGSIIALMVFELSMKKIKEKPISS